LNDDKPSVSIKSDSRDAGVLTYTDSNDL